MDISLDEKEYISNRVDKQIEWYDTKSIRAQKMYKIFTFIILVSSAIIPFIANLTISSFYIKVFVSILGVLGTISQGVINVNKYNENWIEYRTICESLKKEKYMQWEQGCCQHVQGWDLEGQGVDAIKLGKE